MNLHPHSPVASKLNKLVAIAALAALIAVDLTAQRPRRFGRGRPGRTRNVTPPPPALAPAKEIENYVATGEASQACAQCAPSSAALMMPPAYPAPSPAG